MKDEPSEPVAEVGGCACYSVKAVTEAAATELIGSTLEELPATRDDMLVAIDYKLPYRPGSSISGGNRRGCGTGLPPGRRR